MSTASISRRSMIAAGAALAVPAVTAMPALAGTNDLQLHGLFAELQRAHREAQLARDAFKKVEDLYNPPRAPMPTDRRMPAEIQAQFDELTVRQFVTLNTAAPDHPYLAWQRENLVSDTGSRTAWEAECQRLRNAIGFDEAEQIASDADDACYEIAHRIFETPANTIDGLAVKVRTLNLLGMIQAGGCDDELALLADDIEAIDGAGRSA